MPTTRATILPHLHTKYSITKQSQDNTATHNYTISTHRKALGILENDYSFPPTCLYCTLRLRMSVILYSSWILALNVNRFIVATRKYMFHIPISSFAGSNLRLLLKKHNTSIACQWACRKHKREEEKEGKKERKKLEQSESDF